jgi:GR25 family glycosyltransferase involved in LPS biosynthesis
MEYFLQERINIFRGYHTGKNSLDRQAQLDFLRSHDPKLSFAREYNFTMSGQIGCYLSHHMLIKKIMESYANKTIGDEYSVIFEDDAVFEPSIKAEIKKVIATLEKNCPDFDVIFLGNLTQDCCADHFCDNLYYIHPDKHCWGTHALLINNKKIKKLYDLFCNIITAADGQYKENIMEKKMIGFVVHPILAFQDLKLKSRIWNNK